MLKIYRLTLVFYFMGKKIIKITYDSTVAQMWVLLPSSKSALALLLGFADSLLRVVVMTNSSMARSSHTTA